MTAEMTEGELATYKGLVSEMYALSALEALTIEQANRWASLSGARLALYSEEDESWMAKAVQGLDRRWYLVSMAGPSDLIRKQAEAGISAAFQEGGH